MDNSQQTLIATGVLLVTLFFVIYKYKEDIKKITLKLLGMEVVIELDTDSIRRKLEQQGVQVVLVENERSDILERDAVISSFTVLHETIFSLARSKNMTIPPLCSALNVLNILIAEKILPVELAEPIRELYNFGKQVSDHPNDKVLTNVGRNYRTFVSSFVSYIRDNINVPPMGSGGKPNEKLKRTQIGNPGFSAPKLEKPSAVLYATVGSIQGRRFPIDKTTFHIGANPRNDLVIPDDSFVSGNHAYIRYDNGNLNLFDDQSTNGTFLNNQRLATQPLSLRIGDQIKIGGCTFTVE